MKTFEEALRDKNLNDSTCRLYMCIWKNIQMTPNGFTKTNEEITEYLGHSRTTISKSIAQLIELGYITKSTGQKVNTNGQITIANGEAYRTLTVTDNVEVKSKKDSPKKIESIKNFEIFWKDRVRNKVGKEAALKSWIKLTIDEQRIAYEKIALYYDTVEDSRFFAHTSTWLNGKRFNDENLIPQHKAKSGQRWNDHIEQTDEERRAKLNEAVKLMKEKLAQSKK